MLSLGYVLTAGSWGSPASFAVANLLMLCPAVVANVFQRLVLQRPIARPLGLRLPPTRWFLFAWMFPPIVMLAALAFSLMLPAARFAPDMGGLSRAMASFRSPMMGLGVPPLVGMLVLGLALGPTLNAIGGLGEELGWRGFLYEELTSLGLWKCSLLTGALWALWHVPLFFEGYGDPQYPTASALGMLAFALSLAPILHFVRWRSGSVVACGVLHGTMSSTRLISIAFVRDAGPWTHAAIPMVLLIANLGLLTVPLRGQEGRSADSG
jgi:membrane protease YdiL (CAAX protease family)